MTQEIKRILDASHITNRAVINFNEEKDNYVVEWNVNTPRETSDLSEILKVKNKIRAQVNKAYTITFVIKFTT